MKQVTEWRWSELERRFLASFLDETGAFATTCPFFASQRGWDTEPVPERPKDNPDRVEGAG